MNMQQDDLRKEDARLAALSRYGVLGGAKDSFDQATRLASRLLNAPMAAISLIDRDRRWFKSHIGFSTVSTARANAFCDHVVRNRKTVIVRDALADARFAQSPLVHGELKLRFYAGAPIVVEGGHALGALCVMDRRPRDMGSEDIATMEYLASVVADDIEFGDIDLVEEPQKALSPASPPLEFALTERERLILKLLTARAGSFVAEGDLAGLAYGVFAPQASASRVRADVESLTQKLAILLSDRDIITRSEAGYRLAMPEFALVMKRYPGVFGGEIE